MVVIEQQVASNKSDTIKANVILGFTAAHCVSSNAAEYYVDKGDATQGGTMRMEPILLDEEKDVAAFILANRTVQKLGVEPARRDSL